MSKMAGKKIVKRIKESLNLSSRTPSPQVHASTPAVASSSSTPFTTFVISRLDDEESKVYAMTFAPQIQVDCDAPNLVFDDYYHLLGHTEKKTAVRTLKRAIPDHNLLHTSVQNSTGRPRDVYMVSVNQFEAVMLEAKTAAGRKWRDLVLKIKNLVVQYMKMEMEISARFAQQQLEEQKALAQQQLEEQMTKLAIRDKELEGFNAQKEELEAALLVEKERRALVAARRKDEDEPRETVYLFGSGNSVSVKIGETARKTEKRQKELQTGNPEIITKIFEIRCIDSKLIEDILHFIFRWYKKRGEWYDIKAETAIQTVKTLVSLVDGLRRVEHDDVDIIEACQTVLVNSGLNITDTVTPNSNLDRPSIPEDPYGEFRASFLQTCSYNSWLQWMDLLANFRAWHDRKYPNMMLSEKGKDVKAIKEYFESKLGRCQRTKKFGRDVNGFFGWKLRSEFVNETSSSV